MLLLDLDKLKRREEELRIPLVDMTMVTMLFVAIGLISAVFLLAGTAWTLQWGSAILLLWQMGIFASAGTIGFLFGHPRVARQTQEADQATDGKPGDSTTGKSKSTPDRRPPRSNRLLDPSTALQDIVDWLTKIIVGVGLVELRQIPEHIYRLATVIGASVSAVAPANAGVGKEDLLGLGVAVIVVSAGSGLVFGYLMTRLYLQGAISRADERLSSEAEALKERLEISRTLTVPESVPTDVFTTDATNWDSDPHKGVFGGKPEADGWILTAVVVPSMGPNKPICNVTLTVRSLQPASLTPGLAIVTFHLHPTYEPETEVVPVEGGVATLEIVSWGAFTVGAEVKLKDKSIRLELDLMTVTGGTKRFYEE